MDDTKYIFIYIYRYGRLLDTLVGLVPAHSEGVFNSRAASIAAEHSTLRMSIVKWLLSQTATSTCMLEWRET